MALTDFDFDLPDELLARHPKQRRSESRLLRLQADGRRSHHTFSELPSFLRSGDLMVLNDTAVFKARLFGEKAESGGKVELLLVSPLSDKQWLAMVRTSKRMRPGQLIRLLGEQGPGTPSAEGAVHIRICDDQGDGFYRIELPDDAHVLTEQFGQLPLPPYLGRKPEPADEERYQTVYADMNKAYSVAAPTAGLHFTEEILAQLREQGVHTTKVTLHVGPGTFLPVRTEDIEQHQMHREHYVVGQEAADAVNQAMVEGRRIVAVGTTSARVLESFDGQAGEAETQLFIRPGYSFKRVSALITNFHLPKSTLLMLVAALCSREAVLEAYREAIRNEYRFYSYGDAMLVERPTL